MTNTNVIPLPPQAEPDDAKVRADAETDIKDKLYKWAEALLEQIGVTQQVKDAQSLNDLQHIHLDLRHLDIVFAIRAAMSPVSGAVEKHFVNMSEAKLLHIIKNRFWELVKERKKDLERGDASAQYDAGAALKLPDLLQAVFTDYVDMPEHDSVTLTLWTLLSHIYDRFHLSPRLELKSPEPGCGKTTTLDLIVLLGARGTRWDSATAATMFRTIDTDHPTLCVDEIDCLDWKGDIEMVFRSGYRKDGKVSRHIQGENRHWSTFGPLAMATVETTMSDAVTDRSLIIFLQKSLHTEKLRDLDVDLEDEKQERINGVIRPIYRQICAWARSKPEINHSPDMPKELHDRRAKLWRILICVADCFGEAWGKKAREAALAALSFKKVAPAKLMLISCIRVIHEQIPELKKAGALLPEEDDDRCRAATFVEALLNQHDAPWNEYCGLRGDKTPHKIKAEVTQLLSRYRIHPGTVWPKLRDKNSKSYSGYMSIWFEDALERYCKEEMEAMRAKMSSAKAPDDLDKASEETSTKKKAPFTPKPRSRKSKKK